MSHLAAASSYSGPGALRRRLFLVAALLVSGALVLGILVVRGAMWPQSWDDAVRRLLLDETGEAPRAEHLGRVLGVIGGVTVVTVVAVAAVVVLLVRRRRQEALFLAVCSLGGVLLNTVIKAGVERPRATDPPPLIFESSPSFPRGHAMAAVYVYGALALVIWALARDRWWGKVSVLVLAALVVLIPLSRLWMGAHYLSDVVAGLLLAGAWVAVAAALTLVGRDEPPVVEWWHR